MMLIFKKMRTSENSHTCGQGGGDKKLANIFGHPLIFIDGPLFVIGLPAYSLIYFDMDILSSILVRTLSHPLWSNRKQLTNNRTAVAMYNCNHIS